MSPSSSSLIKIPSIAKWCYYLAISGGDIVRQVTESGRLNVVNKSDWNVEFDPSTDADRRTQLWVIGQLRAQFPNVSIIGEEEQDDLVSESGHHLPESIDHDPYFSCSKWDPNLKEANPDDVRIFVDPVDGTKDLMRGSLDAVTVLIGIAVAGQPIYGVVHYPFSGETFHAAVGHSQHKDAIKRAPKCAADNIIVTTSSHFDDGLRIYFEKLQPQPGRIVRVGGCGHKAMLVLNGEADAYLYPRKGTKKWDTCAPHAIIRAFHGDIVDCYGKSLRYGADDPITNDNGLICTIAADPALYILQADHCPKQSS